MDRKPTYEELEQRVKELTQIESEHKQLKFKFKNSEKRSLALLENSPVCTKIVDLDFNLHYMSSAGIKKLKIDDITQLYRKPYPLDIYPEPFRSDLSNNFEKVKETGEIITLETAVLDTDGNELWYDATLVPVNDEEGRIDYIIIVSVETTERKKAEKALRESEERFRVIFEQAAVGVSQIETMTGRFVRINNKYCDIVGYTPEEMTKVTFMQITHPDDLQEDLDNLEKLKAGKIREFTMEKRYFHKNGSIVWVNLSVSPFWQQGEKLNYHIAVVEDITERKKAEETLRKRDELLNAIYNGITDVLWVMAVHGDKDFKYTLMNHAGELITGIRSEDWQGKRPEEIVEPKTAAAVRARYMDCLRTGKIQAYDECLQFETGIKWTQTKLIPFHDRNGRVYQIVGTAVDITDRKQAEEELQKSTVHLRTLIQTIPDLIWLKDPDGIYLSCNAKFERFFGAKEADIVGKTDYDFVDKELADIFRKNDTVAMDSGQPCMNEEEITFADDGHRELLETIKTPMYDSEDNIVGILGVARDITERKLTEEELREERERAQTYLNLAGVMFVALDAANTVTLVNQKASEVLGYTKEEIVGRNWFDTCIPQRLRETVKEVSKQLLSGEIEPAEYYENPVLTKTGEERIIAWHNTVLRDDEGLIIGHLSSGNDITDRKQTEEALREKELQLREVANNIPGVIYQFYARPNAEYGLYYISERSEALFGIPNEPDGYFEKVLEQIPSQEEREALLLSTKEAVDDFKSWKFEIPYIKPSGERIWIRGVSTPTQLENEIIFNGVLLDITERIKVEEEKDILQSQLRQTQKIESLGTLAGGIAHEFNNILGIIIGNTELAISDVPQQNSAQNNLEEIQTAGLRARDVVKQLLAFSRITTEDFRPLNLTPIVKENLKLIRASIPTTIEIHQDISAESNTVNADPTQISQVIINLCTNASHAMQENGGILEVRLDNIELGEKDIAAHQDLTAGNYVRLTVNDKGCGMAPETLERIFDPFFTTKEVGQGTGMGLSVVHGIVKDHGGDIAVKSEPGKGTSFQVLFPVIEWILETDVKPSEPTPRGTEQILFVDDEKSIVLAAKHNLENLNYMVVTETDPMRALEVFRKEPQKFDLLITDTTMPGMTGDSLAKAVMEIRSDIPIILCTGYSERISKEMAQEMGIKAFVMKPVVTHKIAKTIRQVLDAVKEEKAPYSSKRILVVDDEDQMRTMIKQMLENAGFKVSEAPDGKVALWINKDKPADLIITDIVMPQKEGIETIMELKNDFPDVKIIAISGGGQGDKVQYLDIAKRVGADFTLEKPFMKEELLKAVKDLLGSI